MLITDLRHIGEKLYTLRKGRGLTQAEVAERAELSDRTYADIERGGVNMRIETLLKICSALNITPDEILTQEDPQLITEAELIQAINHCSENEKQTALKLLSVYVNSLK